MSAKNHSYRVSPQGYRTSIVSTEKRSLAKCIEFAEIGLRNIFGVKDLSIIERFHLKLCVTSVAESIDMQLQDHDKGNLHSATIPSLFIECAWLWVHRCYGVDIPTIDEMTKSAGCARPEFCAWLQLERVRAHLM